MIARAPIERSCRDRYLAAMAVLGHGVDLVETARIRHLFDQHGSHFLDRVFTAAEQAYCDANPKRRFEHLAARFAAKEAVLKALGTGWRGGIGWTDIEVLRDPAGKPSVALHGQAAAVAAAAGIRNWLLSLSHVETHAFASAIATNDSSNE